MNIKYIDMMKKNKNSGFTLLELLIVIAIIAILSVALVIVLNPAETLKKARDSQRISDLSTLKTAIGLYLTNVASPDLGASIVVPAAGAGGQISYSKNIVDVSCGTPPSHGANAGATAAFAADWCFYDGTTNYSNVDGTGWVPINFTLIPGGSPISNLPVDPTNSVAVTTAPASTDLVYRYGAVNANASSKTSYIYEIDAQLESTAYTVTDDKRASDGGDNASYYETGTDLKILPTTTGF